MSVEKLKHQDAHATELLRISAFFGNENIYYNLLAAQNPNLWPGLGDILRTKTGFDRSMAKLRDYSLIETSRRSYRLHPCVHDWTLSGLNQHIEESDIWRAVTCTAVAADSASSIWSTDYDESQSRLASHAIRLMHPRLYDVLTKSELDAWRCAALTALGQVLHRAERIQEAAPLITHALTWSQQHLGDEHWVSLYACNALGLIQRDLQNFSLAESLLKQAVHGFARTLGQYHTKTLDPVHNLAMFYMRLGKFDEAEKMYLWSLRGCEESYGPQDANTFWATMALADFYMVKNELDEAENQFQQALKGFDAAIDNDHFFSRFTAARLGAIYEQRGDYNSAAAMFQRVYESCRRLFGSDHWSTLEAQADLTKLRVKSQWKESSGTASTLAEALTVPPLNRVDHEALRSSETAVSSDTSLQDINPGNPSDILPNPAKKLSRLQCHMCRASLTISTKRFICCICADHELCGNCHAKFRAQQNNDTIQIGQSDHHIFLLCDIQHIPKVPSIISYDSSTTAPHDAQPAWGAELGPIEADAHLKWMKLGLASEPQNG
jgi:tetratricopeptide (TPR) repeat protein